MLTINSGNNIGLYGSGNSVVPVGAPYSNANVALFLPTYSGNLGAGNVNVQQTVIADVIQSNAYLWGNGVNVFSTIYSNSNVANYLPNYTGFVGGTLTSPTQLGIHAIGTQVNLTLANAMNANNQAISNLADPVLPQDAVTLAYLNTHGTGNTYYPGLGIEFTGAGNAYIDAAVDNINMIINGSNEIAITTQPTFANVTATNFFGIASQANAANTALTAVTVTANAQPNITSVGTLTNLISSGNITAAHFIGEGGNLSNIQYANVVGLPPIDAISNGTSNVTFSGANGNIIGAANGVAILNIGYSGTNSFISIGSNAGLGSNSDRAVYIGTNAGNNPTTGGGAAIAIGLNAGGNSIGNASIAVGGNAGANAQAASSIAIGTSAGANTQAVNAVAIGQQAGWNTQGSYAVAIGYNSGNSNQGGNAIAIGRNVAVASQGESAIAIGKFSAGNLTAVPGQGSNAIAVGTNSGQTSQGANSIAIGAGAGYTTQSANSIAIGLSAGYTAQGPNAIAIGSLAAGNSAVGTQGANAIAIGAGAGFIQQTTDSVAIGRAAGYTAQGGNAVAIGTLAAGGAATSQGANAVAIGHGAGFTNQGANSVAIGGLAGLTNQSANSIIINATGATLDATNEGTYIAPIRNDSANVSQLLYYNTTTKEVTYNNSVEYVNCNIPSSLVITANTPTTVLYSVLGDLNGWYNAATGRFQPTVAGRYRITALVTWNPATGTGPMELIIQQNGGTSSLSHFDSVNTVNKQSYQVTYDLNFNGTTDYSVIIVETATTAATQTLRSGLLQITLL